MESVLMLSHINSTISSPLPRPPTVTQRYLDSPPVLNPTGRSAINVVTRDAAALGRPSTGTRIKSELDPSGRSTKAVRGSILSGFPPVSTTGLPFNQTATSAGLSTTSLAD